MLAFAETDAHAAIVTELAGELPELRRVLHIDGSGPKALDQLAEAGASVDPAELTARVEALQRRRPGDADLHLGHHRPPQGLPAHPLQPASTRPAAPRRAPDAAADRAQRLLVFLPLAHVLARALTIVRVPQQGDRRIHQRHQESACRCSRCSSRRSWCRCRGCSRRSTTPPSRTPPATARAGSSRSPRRPPSTGARHTTAAARVCCCGPSTRCSTGWSTASCAPRSAATATRRSPAAHRWARGWATSTAASA